MLNRLLAYDHTVRRRARAARRLIAAGARLDPVREARVVAAYWWDGHPNFGDALTPWLLPHYQVLPVHREPHQARLAGAGSIIEQLPTTFSGVIWGSGLMYDSQHPLARATVFATRGLLTLERIGADAEPPVLGDPGLLAARLVRSRAPRHRLGLVPHGIHRDHPGLRDLARRYPGDVAVIDVRRSPAATIRRIAACEAVVSTSLHGLVVADALGIKAAWTELDPPLLGRTFKFRDHESVVTPGYSRRIDLDVRAPIDEIVSRTAAADRTLVERAQLGLEATIGLFPTTRGSALLGWRHR